MFGSAPKTGDGTVGGFGFGAPVATYLLENFIALGTTEFISIGTAGGLQPGCRAGDVVLCDMAIRDEGVSHHYVASAKYAEASETLTAKLAQELRSADLTFSRGVLGQSTRRIANRSTRRSCSDERVSFVSRWRRRPVHRGLFPFGADRQWFCDQRSFGRREMGTPHATRRNYRGSELPLRRSSADSEVGPTQFDVFWRRSDLL